MHSAFTRSDIGLFLSEDFGFFEDGPYARI